MIPLYNVNNAIKKFERCNKAGFVGALIKEIRI